MRNRFSLRDSYMGRMEGPGLASPSHLEVALPEPRWTEGDRFGHVLFQCWRKASSLK